MGLFGPRYKIEVSVSYHHPGVSGLTLDWLADQAKKEIAEEISKREVRGNRGQYDLLCDRAARRVWGLLPRHPSARCSIRVTETVRTWWGRPKSRFCHNLNIDSDGYGTVSGGGHWL